MLDTHEALKVIAMPTRRAQEEGAFSVDHAETQAALTSSANAALDALSQVDLVLAATEAAEGQRDAAIWTALARRIPSVLPALELNEDDVAALADTRRELGDTGAVAPLAVTLFGAVSGLRRGQRSVLFQVRPCEAACYTSTLASDRHDGT